MKIFFCRRQSHDLRQIRAPPNLTSRQSAAKISICIELHRNRFQVRGTPGTLTHQIFRAGRNERIIIYETSGNPKVRRRFTRHAHANRRTTMTHDHGRPLGGGEQTGLGQLKNSLSIAPRRARQIRRPFQKLPPTAIFCHFGTVRSLRSLQTFHSVLTLGRACTASLGPRAESREREADRSRRNVAIECGFSCHDRGIHCKGMTAPGSVRKARQRVKFCAGHLQSAPNEARSVASGVAKWIENAEFGRRASFLRNEPNRNAGKQCH